MDAASEPGERARPDDAVRPFPSLADSKRRSRRGAPAPEPEAGPPTERVAWPPVVQVPAQPDPYVEVAPQASTAPWGQGTPPQVPTQAVPAPIAPPPPLKQRSARGLWRYAPIPAALLLAVAIVWGALALRDQPADDTAAPSISDSGPSDGTGQEPAAALASGTYAITFVASGLCLGEGPELGNVSKTVLVQADCATASPPTLLNLLEPGVYQLQLRHPVHGIGCVTPDGPDVDELYIGQDCDETGAMEQQRFRLEPAEGGYRLQNVASGHCMAPLGGAATAGVAFAQARCGGPGQSFAFAVK